MMNRREFLKHSSAGVALASLPGFVSNCVSGSRQPNIILILADDFGYEVPGFNGGTSYQTPHLDNLAASGMRFTHCYSAPVCSPSRTELLTGRYTFRTGEEWGVLPENEITCARVLKSAGYRTAMAGKWQFGKIGDDPHFINRKGFDEYCCWGWHEGPRYWNPFIWENGSVREDVKDRYGPDVFREFAVDFINMNQKQPFFLYYPMVLTHFPKKKGDYVEPKGPNGKYESYKEMVENCDRIIGEFTRALDDSGLSGNTVLIFTADNGTPQGIESKMGDKIIAGGKQKMCDSGTHVPLLVKWPGTIKTGSINNNLVDFTDFFPTMVELAKAGFDSNVIIDGKSFARQLTGEKHTAREWVYQEWHGEAWIRTREWKLYRDGRLYDMNNDPDEKNAINKYADDQKADTARNFLSAALKTLY